MRTDAAGSRARAGGAARAAGLAVAAAACAAASGCATPAGVVFEPAASSPSWPPPPDTARIRALGQLRSADDLRAGRGGLERLGDALFGREPARGMVSPMAVCTDGGERVFVADPGAQAVHAFDLGTRRHAVWSPAEAWARLLQPVGIAYDAAHGRVLVSDSQAGRVVAFSPDGKPLGEMGRGALRRPCGLAVDPSTGRVYVADAAAHQVVVLGPDGEETARAGTRGSGPGEFNYPTNVALGTAAGGAGTVVYVSDSLNFRVQALTADLAPLRTVGRKGDMPGYFAQPKGVGVDSEGHLYVVDAHFEAVQLFDDQGRLLMSFGREGTGPGEFWLPAGLSVDARDRVWIADSYNRRVQAFQYLHEGVRP